MKRHIAFLGCCMALLLELGPGAAHAKGKGQAKNAAVVSDSDTGPARDRDRGRRDGKRLGSVKRDIVESLYPVELIRHFASEIRLTEAQIEQIRKVSMDVGNEVEQLKWDVEREASELVDLVQAGGTKEQVYAQMDEVFKYENKIKKKQLGLLIVIRDLLTQEQREHLDDVKRREPGPPGGPRGGDPDLMGGPGPGHKPGAPPPVR